jgi:hypothetical protein
MTNDNQALRKETWNLDYAQGTIEKQETDKASFNVLVSMFFLNVLTGRTQSPARSTHSWYSLIEETRSRGKELAKFAIYSDSYISAWLPRLNQYRPNLNSDCDSVAFQ